MSGTGPPVFTASGGPTPPFAGTSDSGTDVPHRACAGSAANGSGPFPRKPPPKSVIAPDHHRDIVGPAGKPARFSRSQPCLARHPRLLTPEPQGPCSLLGAFRRGGRVVECTALEMRHRCKPIGGSNPSLSANISSSVLFLLFFKSPLDAA